MTPAACPACGGAGTRQGTKERRVLDADALGAPREAVVRVQRWRCGGCAGFFSTGIEAARPRALCTPAAREAVARACLGAGFAGAGRAWGIDEKTARALWDEWAAEREPDPPPPVPEVAGLYALDLAGAPRALVCDALAREVVEVLPGTGQADLARWIARSGGGRARAVVLDLHPPLREAARALWPRARLLLCPSAAAAAGLRAFLDALRGLRRALGRRNVREGARAFAARARDLPPGAREEMARWHAAALDLHAAKERFLEALEAPDPRQARAAIAASLALCPDGAGPRAPALFLGAWGDAIAEAAGDPLPRRLAPGVERLRRAAAAAERRRRGRFSPHLGRSLLRPSRFGAAEVPVENPEAGGRSPPAFDLQRGRILLAQRGPIATGFGAGISAGVPLEAAARALEVLDP